MARRMAERRVEGPGGVLEVRSDDVAARDFLMIIEGETSGRPLEQVLSEYGCSRSHYYERLRRYREQGLEGLWPRPSGPRKPWRRSLEIMRLIVAARLRDPGRSATTITQDLVRGGYRVSLRSVERTIAQFGLTRGAWGREDE